MGSLSGLTIFFPTGGFTFGKVKSKLFKAVARHAGSKEVIMGNIRVIIAGTRSILSHINHQQFNQKLDHLLSNCKADVEVVSGRARGADRMGERYARENGLEIHEYPADWDKYGKRAGYIRNEAMAKVADCLIAFWDGKSRGTKHMINLAKKHGLKVRVVKY